ncbi:MAG: WhiB family transcriptional regulator, partial [Phycisphaerales bacterium]
MVDGGRARGKHLPLRLALAAKPHGHRRRAHRVPLRRARRPSASDLRRRAPGADRRLVRGRGGLDRPRQDTRDHAPHRARCADGEGTFTALFFSDDAIDLARAKAICQRCSLSDDCLAGALERVEYYGVWGGA